MTEERYRRIKALLQRVLELDAADRPAYLARECGDDKDLLDKVMRLLELDVTQDGDLKVLDLPEPQDLTGTSIGPYEIVERLGEGGMGVVYLAAQSAPLRRNVALKVIKLGMDTREVITRFKSERQVLALMDHPNIAKVLDAGATAAGRPYFVMEYIQGIPLTRYCQDKGLGLRRRLDLFIQVCHGVQHAHQKGVIHRDLKPSNILVTEVEGQPVPKIIDFGVAKATGQHLAARTLFTQLGQVVGTPEYMSPEQASQQTQDIDTRSDVFSLGVVLYELMTGVLPITREELLGAGFDRMGLLVRELVPPKPSTRLSSPNAAPTKGKATTAVVPRTWIKRVRGDLDWITMKAIEKERERRYATVSDLVGDLERHLQHQVVQAGPPSRLYRMQKFVHRNWAAVAVGAALALAVTSVAVWQTAQSRIIARERDRALANERLSLARGHVESDPTVAVAYALSSLEILDQPETREVIRTAYRHGLLRDELPRWDGIGNPLACDTSPDGSLCATTWSHSETAKIGLYDLDDYSLRILDSGVGGNFHWITFNADASHVIANDQRWGGGLHVWRVADGKHLHHITELLDVHSVALYRPADPRRIMICATNVAERSVWYELDVLTGDLQRIGRSLGVLIAAGSSQDPDIDPAATLILEYHENRVFLTRFEDLDTDRSTPVGEHDSSVSCVAMAADRTRGVSIDHQGGIKVWDLSARPARLLREFQQEPGDYSVKFDASGDQFMTSWGAPTVQLYDLRTSPPRLPRPLLDRSHWPHEGAFLPDGSLITSRNGIGSGPIARWSAETPIAWSQDAAGRIERGQMIKRASGGKWLVQWTAAGDVFAVPLVDGPDGLQGWLGKTEAWAPGIGAGFAVDAADRRCVFENALGAMVLLDLETGEKTDIPRFVPKQRIVKVSPSGRRGCIYDLEDDSTLRIVDLDRLEVVATITTKSTSPYSRRFTSDTELLMLWGDCLERHDLTAASAGPDTLWRGDASGGGDIFEDGQTLVVRDESNQVTLVDIQSGTETMLCRTPASRANSWEVAYDPDLGLVAVGGFWETLEVVSTRTGQHWHLPVSVGERPVTEFIEFDAFGRWLISNFSTEIVAWTLPLDPVFTDLSTEDMLARTRELTNVRVVPDESAKIGFAITNTQALAAP